MYIKDQTGTGNLYYVFRDCLGSILKLTDGNGNTIAEQSFDAWGKPRDPNNWTNPASAPATPGLMRGFTGHEHLPQFSLINMNGRMYDPIIGRILSADNEVHDAENPQDYNRYSYCLNNPLKYTDPTGYDEQDDDHERPDPDDDDDCCLGLDGTTSVQVQQSATPLPSDVFKTFGIGDLSMGGIQLSSDLNGPAFNGSIRENPQSQSNGGGRDGRDENDGGRDDDDDDRIEEVVQIDDNSYNIDLNLYNSIPVIRVPFTIPGFNVPFTPGPISFAPSDFNPTRDLWDADNEKHEKGHAIDYIFDVLELGLIHGTEYYYYNVAIPSVINNIQNPQSHMTQPYEMNATTNGAVYSGSGYNNPNYFPTYNLK